jgi:hypothetical protein
MHGGIKIRCVTPCGAISQVAAEMGASTHLLVKIAFADFSGGVGAGPAAESAAGWSTLSSRARAQNKFMQRCEGCA